MTSGIVVSTRYLDTISLKLYERIRIRIENVLLVTYAVRRSADEKYNCVSTDVSGSEFSDANKSIPRLSGFRFLATNEQNIIVTDQRRNQIFLTQSTVWNSCELSSRDDLRGFDFAVPVFE